MLWFTRTYLGYALWFSVFISWRVLVKEHCPWTIAAYDLSVKARMFFLRKM